MNKDNLVGRCGLYCGACAIYRAERDSPELRKKLADNFKCEPEQVHCNGCQAIAPDCWGYDCKFVVCLKKKGYEFCYQCPDYQNRTCSQFEEFSKDYLQRRVNLRENLTKIKTNLPQWLHESEELYTCTCGKPLIIGSTKCHHCGKELP